MNLNLFIFYYIKLRYWEFLDLNLHFYTKINIILIF